MSRRTNQFLARATAQQTSLEREQAEQQSSLILNQGQDSITFEQDQGVGVSNTTRDKRNDHFLDRETGNYLFDSIKPEYLPDPRYTKSTLDIRIRGTVLFDIFRALRNGGHLKSTRLTLNEVELLVGYEPTTEICMYSVLREQNERNTQRSVELGRELKEDEKSKLTLEEQEKYRFRPTWFVNVPFGSMWDRKDELAIFGIRPMCKEMNNWCTFMTLVEHVGLAKALYFGTRYYFVNGNYFANADRTKFVPVSGSPFFWDGKNERYGVQTKYGIGVPYKSRGVWSVSKTRTHEYYEAHGRELIDAEEAEMKRKKDDYDKMQTRINVQTLDELFDGLV